MTGKTIRVTTTPAAILRNAVELAERRDGEDRWEMQSRTINELGYRIVGKDDLAQADEVAHLRDALRLIDGYGCTKLTQGRCWDDYTRAAKYSADAWCDSCVAAAALEGRSDTGEKWQPGDVVLDAEGDIWTRAAEASIRDGWPWSAGSTGGTSQPPEGGVAEYGPNSPARPLTLLVRDGKAAQVPDERSAELDSQDGVR